MGREVSSPSNLDTYIGNEHLKDKVSVYLESGDLPHLLLYGKTGTVRPLSEDSCKEYRM